jgi:hypothetical protein
MADLVAGDVTYTALDPVDGVSENGRIRRIFTLTTAAGAYPTGGIPLDNDKLGCPNSLESLVFLEQDPGDPLLTYTWDKSANKIFVVEDDVSTGVPAQHANAAFTSPTQLIVEVIGW